MEDFDSKIDFRISFCLDLEHYLNDENEEEKDAALITPRDPGGFRVWRYKGANLQKRFPLHIRALPLDAESTTDELNDAARRVEHWVKDFRVRFSDVRRRYIGGMLAAGVWSAALNYEPGVGLGLDAISPDRVRWERGYLDPNDPRNPWIAITSYMPPSEIKRKKGWKNVPDELQGDNVPYGGVGSRRWPRNVFETGSRGPSQDENLVAVTKYYCRFEPTKGGEQQNVPLDPGLYHMACPACGWRSPAQAETMTPYPPFVPGGCPKCEGPIGRVTTTLAKATNDYGKKLIICAPFNEACSEPFYSGDWEFDYPTFPLLWVEAYMMPHTVLPSCDTKVLKSPILTSNALLRIGYETALRSRPYFLMPGEGIENARGEQFSFDPERDGDVMWKKATSPDKPEIIQGEGINASVFAMYDRLQSVFRTNESTSETALTPDPIARAKVGTMEQVTETGNIVIDDHGEVLYERESAFLTNVAQALRELPSETLRVQDETGQWVFKALGGPMMPRVQIEVGNGNLLDSLDQEDLKAYQALLAMDPAHRRGFARFAHIDPDVLQQIEADEEQARVAAEQAGMIQPGMPPPMPGQGMRLPGQPRPGMGPQRSTPLGAPQRPGPQPPMFPSAAPRPGMGPGNGMPMMRGG